MALPPDDAAWPARPGTPPTCVTRPNDRPPAYTGGYRQPPAYGQPPNGGPQYPPQYSPPQYGQPPYGGPQYGPPPYGQPQYGQANGRPPYGQAYGRPPYGQAYGRPGQYPQGAPPPERVRRSTWLVVAAMALTVVVVIGGFRVVAAAARSADGYDGRYADLVLRTEDLPDPISTSAKDPSPGFEESLRPLAEPPTVTDPSSAYAFQLTQRGDGDEKTAIRWSPCRPIHVTVSTDNAPDGFLDEVIGALGEVSAATGLVFTLDGRTSEPPDGNRASFLPHLYGDRWAPVVVAFSDRNAVPDLSGGTLGITSVYTATDPRSGTSYLVSGSVYLDTQLLGMAGIGGDQAYVSVLLHELGHVVGLDHVDDSSQLMNPMVSDVATFQDGDLTGLAVLGDGSCGSGI